MPGCVLDDVINERYPTLFHFVGEMELIEDLELVHRCQLRLLPRGKRIHADVRIGIADLGRRLAGSAA